MTDISSMTADDRVRRIIGGNFSLDSLGSAYRQTIDAVRQDPSGHLEAFERIFLQSPLSQARVGELDPVALLESLLPLLPDRTRQVATAVASRFDSAARGREEAYLEAVESDEANDIAFQRQLIDDRRSEIRDLLGASSA